jgi:hypothetical protein
VIMIPAGLGPENDCTGEDHPQLSTTDPSSRQRGCYVRTITSSLQLKNTGLGLHGACRQDEIFVGKPPVVRNSDFDSEFECSAVQWSGRVDW